jgi:AraC-like DNA-binding protein
MAILDRLNGVMAQDFARTLFSTQITEASYYCPPRSRPRQALDIVCAGRENCRHDYLVSRGSFPWAALELVVKGEGWLKIGGTRFRLQTGSLFSYGPGISYQMSTDPKRPMLKYFVDFTAAGPRRETAALQPGRLRQALYPQELGEIMDRLLIEGTRKTAHSRAIANNYLRILLQKANECAPVCAGANRSRALASYLKAKAFLDEHHEQLSSGEAAAEKLGITPETLCRLFQRFSNTSPYRYLLQLKMNRAVGLLLGTGLLVKEVGQRAGFDDPFHFSRIFKRLQGIAPENFRSLHARRSS